MHKYIGLSSAQATKKLQEFGFNELKAGDSLSAIKILIRQIKTNIVIYLLFITAIISLFLGKSITSYVIFIVIFIVVITGFIQEYKAEKSLQALKQMLVAVIRVVRGGKEQEIPSREIVPGDILILRLGQKIPADCIVIDQDELRINESVLTGESLGVKKSPILKEGIHTDENMLFMGTYITGGKCVAKVVSTGMNTKFGKIASMISKAEKKLPLQDKINKISKYMIIVAVTSSVITGLVLGFRADSITNTVIVDILILVIALCVSSFPEGLPVVLITTLATGVNKMAKKNAVVNRMSIIETLGETTVICSDKTGTLTKGEMTVRKIIANSKIYSVTGIGYEAQGTILHNNKPIQPETNTPLKYLIASGVLCNDATIEVIPEKQTSHIFGSPTEGALLVLGAKAHIFKEDFNEERAEEMPFNSERKMMSVSFRQGDEYMIHAKGALEILLKKCTHVQREHKIEILTLTEKQEILAINHQMASQALRTLGFAYKRNKAHGVGYREDNFIFLGVMAMEDPPRAEAKEAVRMCLQGGIKVKMITGDNKETAHAIAEEIGLKGNILEGNELNILTDEELAQAVNNVAIFARVKPEQKLRIVRALKHNGEIVTMTGDGVNDAPALKEAHIGVAMGRNGTDVSRSVADITLKDDNFATIVVAIKEGRTIYNNIRKFTIYQLSCNFSDILILFFGVLLGPSLGWQIPIITALQILFINIVTDNIPAITLGFTPTSPDIMKEKPRENTQILTKEFIRVIIANGTLMALIMISVLYVSYNVLKMDPLMAQTTVLASIIIMQIANAYNFRSFRFGVINKGFFINKFLVYASFLSLILTIAAIYSPLNIVFETVPIGLTAWTIAIIAGISIIIIFDILKSINNKSHALLAHTT